MHITLGGARGSSPVSGPEFIRHGGDTFAVLIQGVDGTPLIVDAGTGIHRFIKDLALGGNLFMTHLHLDHLLGLPALSSAWPANIFSCRDDTEAAFRRVFSPPVWPVDLPPAAYIRLDESGMTLGGLQLRTLPVAHPDGCVACRVDEPATGQSAVIATDMEWGSMTPEARARFIDFAAGTDCLFMDAHFLPEELPAHRGWGHSSWEEAVEAAEGCRAKTLRLIHHAPWRTDDELDAILAAAKRRFPATVM